MIQASDQASHSQLRYMVTGHIAILYFWPGPDLANFLALTGQEHDATWDIT